MKADPNISRHRPAVHGGIFSIPGPRGGVLDFSSSVNPLGIMPQVLRSMQKNPGLFQEYPDPESESLREDLGSYTGAPPSQIVVGNGATEIIHNFCRAFLSRSTPVLIPAPTFGEYEAAARLAGARPSFFETMDLEGDLPAFLSAIPRDGCVFVCNPNNPTGTLASGKSLERIAARAGRNNTLAFVDECFIELVPGRGESAVPLVKRHKNAVVLRSFTKSFALAGMRLGYCVCPAAVAAVLGKAKIPWNVSGAAQKAGSVALSDPSYLDRARKVIGSEARFLRERISGIEGFECRQTAANFILVRTDVDSTLLQERLLKRNILVRDCKSFRGLDGSFVRVAVKTRKENRRLVEALEAL